MPTQHEDKYEVDSFRFCSIQSRLIVDFSICTYLKDIFVVVPDSCYYYSTDFDKIWLAWLSLEYGYVLTYKDVHVSRNI